MFILIDAARHWRDPNGRVRLERASATTSRFIHTKIIDNNVEEFSYNKHLLTTNNLIHTI